MNEVSMLRGAEPRKILQTFIAKKVPAIMSYLSNGKWHVAKVLPTNLGANRLDMCVLPRERPRPINIQVYQPVGVSLKFEYGKFIFETKVIALKPSPDATSGGTIAVAVPDRIEVAQRRSYFRVDVPRSLKVSVVLWHRGWRNVSGTDDNRQAPPIHCWQGKLVDISAGGAQIAVPHELNSGSPLMSAERPDFKKGQFIRLRFTPMPYEVPLALNAQIRNILPTADKRSICLGLQIVGLEASSEGRQALRRLCNVVEQYHQINQSSAKQQDLQPIRS